MQKYVAIGIGIMLFILAIVGGITMGVVSQMQKTAPSTGTITTPNDTSHNKESTPESTTPSPQPPAGKNTLSDTSAKLSQVEKNAKIQTLTSGMKVEHDDMKNVTFYTYPNDNPPKIHITPYVGYDSSSNRAWLRNDLDFYSDDWIFFEQVLIKTDTKTHVLAYNRFQGESDVLYGSIHEWYDLPMDEKTLDAMRDAATSHTVKVRFQGKFSSDYTLTTQEIQQIKNMLDLCDVLNS